MPRLPGRRITPATVLRRLLALALLVPLVSAVAPAQAATPSVMVSSAPKRTNAVELHGSSPTGDAYVFLANAPSDTTSVRFWLDRPTSKSPTQIERSAPYDLMGGKSTPVSLNTASLTVGSHTVVAEVITPRGGTLHQATFTRPEPESLGLAVSEHADRRDAVPLDRATLGFDQVYIHAKGAPTGAMVSFWLDRSESTTPTQVERNAPYDLMGGTDAVADALDLSALAAGEHTVTARATNSLGTWTTKATFSVQAPLTSQPTPSASSTPTPTPTPSSTTTSIPATTTSTPAPTSSTSTTTTSTPSLGAGTGSWPSSDTTGPVADAALTTVGSLKVTTPGSVIEEVLVEGCVDVYANDVTIKNSVIRCSRPDGGAIKNHAERLTVSDTEVDGLGSTGSCVGSSGFTLLRVDIHNCQDGVRANGDVVIRDSYIHHLARTSTSHNDAIQTTKGSNILIERNALMPYNTTTNDPMNAAIIVAEDQGEVSSFRVIGNYMNGGNHTVMIGSGMSGVTFDANEFGRDYRYGAISSVPSGVTWTSSNVWAGTTQSVR